MGGGECFSSESGTVRYTSGQVMIVFTLIADCGGDIIIVSVYFKTAVQVNLHLTY